MSAHRGSMCVGSVLFLYVLVFAGSGCGGDGDSNGQSGEVLALSYNVAGLPDFIKGDTAPATHMPLISPLLNGYELVLTQESWQTPDPDLLGLATVYYDLLAADALHPFRSVPVVGPVFTDPRRPAAIFSDGLNRFSAFPFEEPLREAWTGCGWDSTDCLALKGFSAARTHFATGVEVDVYNLHLEAGGDDSLLRGDNVEQLIAFMAMHSAGHAVIVGGDFNLRVNRDIDAAQFTRLLDATGLLDVCDVLSCPDPERIDKFLFRSSDGLEISPSSRSVESDLFVNAAGEPLSDHDPLAVRFAWARR